VNVESPGAIDLVIDASVGVKWFVPEIHSGEAFMLLGDGFRRHVPVLFYTEVAQTLWKKIRLRQELIEADGREICRRLLLMSLEVHPTDSVLETAFGIALDTGRTVYDSIYLATSKAMNCELVTADRRLYNAAQGTPLATSLIWIADIPGRFPGLIDPDDEGTI
jgi:predicted nucleic acid-binding protein